MAHNPGLFSYLQTYLGPDFVIVGNRHKLNILGIGNIPVTDGKHHILLKDVLLVPQLTRNLLSIHQLNNHYDASCEFTKEMFCVKERQTGKTLLIGKRKGELYVLPKTHSALFTHVQSASETTWHQRLGHPQSSSLHSLASKGLISLGSSSRNKELCSSCCLGKMSKLSFPQSTNKSTSSFDTVHCDLWGPAPVPSLLGSFRYYALFVDDFSRYMWFTPMKTRDEFFDVYIAFEKYVFRQFSKQIKVFHSDNGGEFINRKLASHFQRHGIVHQLSCPHTPEQMGRVERRHRIIRELGMTMLFHSGVPTHFWPESFATAVFLINRLPSSALSFVSPYFRLFESHPVYSFLRVFGCRCYPYVWDRRQNKFSPKSVPCVFLGYCNRQKGFKCFHPSTRKIIVSRHVKFDETILPYQGTYPSSTALSPFLNDALTFPDPEPSSVELLPLPTSSLMCPSLSLAARPIAQHANTFTSQSLPTGLIPLSPQSPAPAFELYPSSPSPCHSGSVHSRSPSHSPSALPLDTPISSSALDRSPPTYVSDPQAGVSASPPTTSIPTDALVHPMITRRRNGIVKPNPKYALTVSYAHIPEIPRSTQSAVRHDGWRQAMLDELAALHHNSTWTLVPRHPRQHVIGCKWVYKAKLHANGSLERLKARLVAKGFHQVDGIDFHETYSPVIKPTTVRVLLFVALVSGWQVRQLDVKNVFLHGHITEDIYMEQPPGFADRQHPHHVCKLHRALYGLRQAPRAWFDRFSTFLLKLGFYCSFADSSLFVSNSSAGLIVLILYVDDMLITGSNPDHIDRFVSVFHTEFAMKDLGPVHHFLGIEVQHNDQGLLLVQSHFASTILDKAQMLDCKPQRTPLPSKVQQPANSPLLPDPTFYRTLIGSLQYLTFTRPDIAFAVNFAAQFSQCPTLFSLSLVRRILRYIKGTLSLGMQFSTASSLDLCAFSDSDWGGCITTRRSTTGFCTFLGRNLISWCAKKQPTISRSSTEAEYRAMAHTAVELTWLTYLLRDFGITRPRTPLLLCDNISALHMTVNPVFHARTKHIEIDYHFVRERVAHGSLITRHIASHLQLADVFTKPQSKASLASIRTKLCLLPRHSLRADNNSTLEWSHKDGRRDKEATQVRTPTSDMSPSSTKTDEQCVSDSTQSKTNED